MGHQDLSPQLVTQVFEDFKSSGLDTVVTSGRGDCTVETLHALHKLANSEGCDFLFGLFSIYCVDIMNNDGTMSTENHCVIGLLRKCKVLGSCIIVHNGLANVVGPTKENDHFVVVINKDQRDQKINAVATENGNPQCPVIQIISPPHFSCH